MTIAAGSTALAADPLVSLTSAGVLRDHAHLGVAGDGGLITTTITGEIKLWSTDSVPSGGWLFCNGVAISRTTYAALFAVIGTTFGVGDGSTTFNTPDLRGRVPVGSDDMGTTAASRVTTAGSGVDGATLGASGGAQNHTLTTAQIPAHTHPITGSSATGAGDAPGAGNNDYLRTFNTQDNTGGGEAHNNVQPTLIVNYIIKT